MNPFDVRKRLVEALELDLVGPEKGSPLEAEELSQAPSRWYLTGFLAPNEASAEQKVEPTSAEDVFELESPGAADDAAEPEPASAKQSFFPSAIGMSVLVPADSKKIKVTARWGDYSLEGAAAGSPDAAEGSPKDAEGRADEAPADGDDEGDETETEAGGGRRRREFWKRTQREASIEVDIPETTARPIEKPMPGSDGLTVMVSVRAISAVLDLPEGARSLSAFLVNRRRLLKDEIPDPKYAFQAEFDVECDRSLVPRANVRGVESADPDERIADLQYRDVFEYSVGHGVSTEPVLDEAGGCRKVRTRWMPTAEVEYVAPEPIEGAELGLEALGELKDGEDAKRRLGPLVAKYREWIEAQRAAAPKKPKRRALVAEELLARAGVAANRIEEGIALLANDAVLEAFRTANRAMAAAARRRAGFQQGKKPDEVEAPRWHPFQIAFLLMNLTGIVEPTHPDREAVDLLFFPTGGGKTEAYLGLAAFALVFRRLRHKGAISAAGLAVLMRYTLRLLTLDQLGRAAALVCALELEREKRKDLLGAWPFEIGLWVGKAATPNRMGRKGDGDSSSARAKTIAFQNDERRPAPIPLEECPWCGTKFKKSSFRLVPEPDEPKDLRVTCVNRDCDFTRDRPLPILSVDEPIYRRLPGFLIATVDKFASMPWVGDVGGLFGGVDRHDKDGFYGPTQSGRGERLPSPIDPPDLVIQDELHLISGPMGTMAGLYETAIDALSTREVGGKRIRPKVVASTATVRRAERQILALFDRRHVEVFPPPGPDRRHSFFARTHTPNESHARLYLGIAAQGRSLKVVLLRTYLVLMAAAQRAFVEAGGKKTAQNPADPYMTLVGYFNSLRELGGSRRIVEDEVRTRLQAHEARKRLNEAKGLFANRLITYEAVELTSREPTGKVAETKRRLALPFQNDERVDVALATNMISVGLDILRLGLMVVLGQPKTSAEYIQATSRVGRDKEKPGLVVTLFNIHKPRDRSHFERFGMYHRTFYRSVEAMSATPFSPRALDRGLAGTAVALARLGHPPMTPALGAFEILARRGELDFVVDAVAARAESTAGPLPPAEVKALRAKVRDRVKDLLDEWCQIAKYYEEKSSRLQYWNEAGAAQPLLRDFLDPEIKNLPTRHRKFRANRSLRDVEPSVNLWMKTLDGQDVEDDS